MKDSVKEIDIKKLNIENIAPNHLKITFPNDFSYVRIVRKACIDFVKGFIENENKLFQLEILIDEVCNNAIEHGSPLYKMQDIYINIWCRKDEIKVRIQDGGKGYRVGDDELNREFSKEIIKEREELFEGLREIRRGRGLLLLKELSSYFDINLDPVRGSVIEFSVCPRSSAGRAADS
ncbi:MAG: ATP-binding protein [Candidatus Hydrogenedentota bacterium]